MVLKPGGKPVAVADKTKAKKKEEKKEEDSSEKAGEAAPKARSGEQVLPAAGQAAGAKKKVGAGAFKAARAAAPRQEGETRKQWKLRILGEARRP